MQRNFLNLFFKKDSDKNTDLEDCLEPEEREPLLVGKRCTGSPFILSEKRDNKREEKDRQLGELLWLDCQTKQAQLSKTVGHGGAAYSEAFAELIRAKKQYKCWRTYNLISLLEEFKALPEEFIEPSLKKFEGTLPEQFLGLLEKYKLLTEEFKPESEAQSSLRMR